MLVALDAGAARLGYAQCRLGFVTNDLDLGCRHRDRMAAARVPRQAASPPCAGCAGVEQVIRNGATIERGQPREPRASDNVVDHGHLFAGFARR
jgi:hypothetical protein